MNVFPFSFFLCSLSVDYCTMLIEVSDHIIEITGLSVADIRLMLAIQLFEEEILSLGQASKFASLHQFEFQKELMKRKVPLHYDESDFKKDLETVRSI